METLLFIILIVLLFLVFVLFKQNKKLKGKKSGSKSQISTEITKIKSIGELNVFKIYSKEIVTKKDSPMEGFWDTLLGWSMTKRQIAVIFEFEINFIYDLNSEEFSIKKQEDGSYKITMPPCKYNYNIKDMKIYDEKNAKFLPFLLPDSLNGIFGSRFDEADKNRIIDEAKEEVKNMSIKIINDLEEKIHKSARDTLEAISSNFGIEKLSFEFVDKNINKIDLKNSKIEIDNFLKQKMIS
ncbi:DUF4230 domain-containing protein [Campylobacter blaseri]|uniref:DUF4230 domain-containing protein n=1 Tax=Campylobacter blaseri TaxID=2042961 RepID=A0A2P8R2C9_9BACT|nr:DUF4230 domain-containing protein [Campylobacter blaseri]PSM52642.1 hypothetical protein CQ405_02615 [Campylobacter blaseri]PSM54290.1 hypothetical protein CRN67_02615 [Campylobacter blaseri]QKF85941.1 DUF4230 domain-containing protein [Campylobacter blaseri]